MSDPVRSKNRRNTKSQAVRKYFAVHGPRDIKFSLPYTNDQLKSKYDYWGNKCWICGTSTNLSIDHYKPISKGGYDILANIRPACRSCNSKKKDKWPYKP